MEKLKDFLRKIKLIENLSVEVPLNTAELVKKLDAKIDEDAFDWLEGFSSSKNEFKGVVNSHGFKIRKKLQAFNKEVMTTASGFFIAHNETTQINIEIIGYDKGLKIFYCILMFFLLVILFSALAPNDNQNPAYALPVMFLLEIIFFVGPYIMMRRSMKTMKSDLERELFLLTKN